LPVSLDCPIFIALSKFSNVYLLVDMMTMMMIMTALYQINTRS